MRRRSRGLLQFSTRFSLYTLPGPGRCREGATHPVAGRSSVCGSWEPSAERMRTVESRLSEFTVAQRGAARAEYSIVCTFTYYTCT